MARLVAGQDSLRAGYLLMASAGRTVLAPMRCGQVHTLADHEVLFCHPCSTSPLAVVLDTMYLGQVITSNHWWCDSGRSSSWVSF